MCPFFNKVIEEIKFLMCYYFYEWDNSWNIENLDTEKMIWKKHIF